MIERKVAIVTDYAADLPENLNQFGINKMLQIPLSVRFGEKEYLVGIDMDNTLYRELVHQYWDLGKIIPQTSAPGLEYFSRVYKEPVEAGYTVLSIHLGDNVSNTGDMARTAAKEFPRNRVKIYNTGTVSMAQGFMAISAQKAAESGANLEEIIKILDSQKKRTHLRAITPNIPFLRASGRVSHLTGILASALDIKPIIQIDHDMVNKISMERTMKKAIDWNINYIKNIGKIERISLVDFEAEKYAGILETRLIEEVNFPESRIYRGELGPITGSHSGPGTLALIVVRK